MTNYDRLKLNVFESWLDDVDKHEIIDIMESCDDDELQEVCESVEELLTVVNESMESKTRMKNSVEIIKSVVTGRTKGNKKTIADVKSRRIKPEMYLFSAVIGKDISEQDAKTLNDAIRVCRETEDWNTYKPNHMKACRIMKIPQESVIDSRPFNENLRIEPGNKIEFGWKEDTGKPANLKMGTTLYHCDGRDNLRNLEGTFRTHSKRMLYPWSRVYMTFLQPTQLGENRNVYYYVGPEVTKACFDVELSKIGTAVYINTRGSIPLKKMRPEDFIVKGKNAYLTKEAKDKRNQEYRKYNPK